MQMSAAAVVSRTLLLRGSVCYGRIRPHESIFAQLLVAHKTVTSSPGYQAAPTPDWGSVLIVLAGVLFSLYLALQVPDEVFINGDGGVKLLLAKEFLAGHWGPYLRPPADAFVGDLWLQGYGPLNEPFVYLIDGRFVQCFPVFFSLITAPFYALLGFRGLYVVPLAALWAVWLRFWLFGHSLGLHRRDIALGLAALIFATPLTVYGATYWEHTLAVALAFSGLVELIRAAETPVPDWRLAAGGVLLGLACWFRPENMCFAAAWLSAWFVPCWRAGKLRSWMIASLGVVGALAAFFAFNLAVYDHPLGAHSFSVLQKPSFWEHLRSDSLPLFLPLGWELVSYMPQLLFAALAVIWFFFRDDSRQDRRLAPLSLTVLLYWLSVPIIVTHSGGVQFGPRYLLNAAPLLSLAVMLALERLREQGRWRLALCMLAPVLGWGLYVNSVQGLDYLRDNYHNRVLPALRFLRQRDEEFVVINHQYVAQELASAWDRKRFLRADGAEQFVAIAGALEGHGVQHFLLFVTPVNPAQVPALIVQKADDLQVEARLLGKYGRYYIYEAQITAHSIPGK